MGVVDSWVRIKVKEAPGSAEPETTARLRLEVQARGGCGGAPVVAGPHRRRRTLSAHPHGTIRSIAFGRNPFWVRGGTLPSSPDPKSVRKGVI